jgi:cysteine desulfurase family protein
MIYLDNAATSWPKPESVYLTMDQFMRNKGGSPGRGGHSMAAAAQEVIEETRTLIARFINAPEIQRVVFTLNCTDALNIGLKGFLKPGDHVITSCIGHNSVVRPLNKLVKQDRISITRIPPSPNTGVVSGEDIEDAITKDTRLLVITHASNVTGIIQPISEYGKIARKHNLAFMVDAAQTAGKHPVDVQDSKVDLLALSGHKGLFGPQGTGVLWVSSRVELETSREGGTGSHSEQEEQPGVWPYRCESGTVNGVGISGLGAGVKYILNEGMDKISNYELSLVHRLIEGLSNIPGFTLYGTERENVQAPVLSFNIKGYDPGEVGAILDQAFDIKVRTGLHCAPAVHRNIGTYPSGTIRLSPGYFNTIEEIDLTLKALKEIAINKLPKPLPRVNDNQNQ